MPTKSDDNAAERLARLEALVEEYRVQFEALKAELKVVSRRTGVARRTSRQMIRIARRVRKER